MKGKQDSQWWSDGEEAGDGGWNWEEDEGKGKSNLNREPFEGLYGNMLF